ncbi:MAG: EF-hand domain-containing protein [Pseudomonadota bacterium]
MSTWKLATLGLLIPVALAAPALAQDRGGPGGPRMVFEELDLNNDGSVTLEELQGAGEARFVEADTDGDGALSRDELIAQAQNRTETRVDRMIERADSDGDGALSAEELADARANNRRGPSPDRILERFDADGDGAVTRAEFDEAAERFMSRRGHDRDRG